MYLILSRFLLFLFGQGVALVTASFYIRLLYSTCIWALYLLLCPVGIIVTGYLIKCCSYMWKLRYSSYILYFRRVNLYYFPCIILMYLANIQTCNHCIRCTIMRISHFAYTQKLMLPITRFLFFFL